MADSSTVQRYLSAIEQIIDDFVNEFDMIGLILVDRKGRIITSRNIGDFFDTSKLAKMISANFPDVRDINTYYSIESFSWLIFQNDSDSLLVHPVGDKVALGMMVKNDISLSFYKLQVVNLSYRLGVNFNKLYQALKED